MLLLSRRALMQCGLALVLWTIHLQVFDGAAEAFVLSQNRRDSVKRQDTTTALPASLAPSPFRDNAQSDFWIEKNDLKSPIMISLGGEREKIVEAFGIWTALVSIATMPFWMLAMTLVDMYSKMNPEWDPHRALFDKTGKVWSKAWLRLINSYPTISGDLYSEGPCLYVANHASWLDIPVLCTCLEPCFKFIAKGELSKLPGIGHQLVGGKHILIDRDDRRSQLKTFKDGIGWLKKGVPLMAFPEGTRSKTGRLMDFKGGMFAMAMKTGVPIVPLTLSHTHSIYPPYALLPVQAGANKLHVHIHEPIQSKGRTDEELSTLVRDAFLSALPECQKPLPSEEIAINEPVTEQAMSVR